MSEMSDAVHTDLNTLVSLQYQAQGFSFLPRQPVHSILAGKKASRLRGRGLNFEELRNYRPGDDLRTMDWKASLRSGTPYVRVYSEERDRPVFLIVDQRVSMFFGSQLKMKSVVAAELAALAAWRSLGQGDRVGAIVFNDTECSVIKPARSKATTLRILQEITRMNQALPELGAEPKSESQSFNEALSKAENLASHDCLICAITDCGGVDEESRKIMTRAAQRNDILAILIYDPLGARLPQAGRVVFSSGKSQLEVDTGKRQVRESFAGEFDDRVTRATHLLQQRSIPFLKISAAEDPLKQLRRALGQAIR